MKVPSQEWKVLGLFAAGISCNLVFTQYSWRFVLAVYLAGIGFEYATRSLWIYQKSILNSPFTVKGVNLILGLGWVGLILLGLTLSWLIGGGSAPLASLIATIVGIGIIGNLIEQLYLALGIFTYNLKSEVLGFPFGKIIMLLRIPLSVRLGYFTAQPFIAWLLLKITHG